MPLTALIIFGIVAATVPQLVFIGLLPEVAADLMISLADSGWLVAGYALGMTVGTPLLLTLTQDLAPKSALIVLMAMSIIGSLLSALAADYNQLMFARMAASLCHGAFIMISMRLVAGAGFGGARLTVSARMLCGATSASAAIVLLGVILGLDCGWRTSLVATAGIGLLAIIGFALSPSISPAAAPRAMYSQLATLKLEQALFPLLAIASFAASLFVLLPYAAPLLRENADQSADASTWTLLALGAGVTMGAWWCNTLMKSNVLVVLALSLTLCGASSAFLTWTSMSLPLACATLALWLAMAFVCIPALLQVCWSSGCPTRMAALPTIVASGLGCAMGTALGSLSIKHGLGLDSLPLISTMLAVTTLCLMLLEIQRREQVSSDV